jgi:hypothetical protein
LGHASIVTRLRSALVRPLSPRYPTNLAVMILAPAAGAALGAMSFGQSHEAAGALIAAGRGALAAFGGWALAREIAPDNNAAAFASMGLVLLTMFFVPTASLLPIFLAIMLARILNRSVGVPASLSIQLLSLCSQPGRHTAHIIQDLRQWQRRYLVSTRSWLPRGAANGSLLRYAWLRQLLCG